MNTHLWIIWIALWALTQAVAGNVLTFLLWKITKTLKYNYHHNVMVLAMIASFVISIHVKPGLWIILSIAIGALVQHLIYAYSPIFPIPDDWKDHVDEVLYP